MRIERINNGIVLDHIRAGKGVEILKLFSSDILRNKIDFASYVDSGRLGTKDIIKIEDLSVDPKMLLKMTLLAPDISISTIREGKVFEKLRPTVPEMVDGVIQCKNPKCVTLTEPYLTSKTRVQMIEKDSYRLQCCYCEHVFYSLSFK